MTPDNGQRLYIEYGEKTLKANVYLVRHGQTVANTSGDLLSDPELTLQGRVEAQTAGERLRRIFGLMEPAAIVHTGLLRTIQTAEIIREAGKFTAPLVEMPEFRERGMGIYDQVSFSQFLENNHDLQPFYDQYGTSCVWFLKGNQLDGVEPLVTMQRRIMSGLSHLQSLYRDKPVVIIGHAGSVKMLRMAYEGNGTDAATYMSSYVPKNCEIYSLGVKE